MMWRRRTLRRRHPLRSHGGSHIVATILLDVLIGGLAGLLACYLAAFYVARYREEPFAPAAALRVDSAVPMALGLGLLGGYLGWVEYPLRATALTLLLSGVFLAVALVDLQVRRIPNDLVLALGAGALLHTLVAGLPIPAAGLGALVGGGAFMLLFILGRGAMGAGDVKFMAAVGLLVGYPLIIRAMLWGIVLGGVAALALLLARRAGRKDAMPYGPYLALGSWVVWLMATALA